MSGQPSAAGRCADLVVGDRTSAKLAPRRCSARSSRAACRRRRCRASVPVRRAPPSRTARPSECAGRVAAERVGDALEDLDAVADLRARRRRSGQRDVARRAAPRRRSGVGRRVGVGGDSGGRGSVGDRRRRRRRRLGAVARCGRRRPRRRRRPARRDAPRRARRRRPSRRPAASAPSTEQAAGRRSPTAVVEATGRCSSRMSGCPCRQGYGARRRSVVSADRSRSRDGRDRRRRQLGDDLACRQSSRQVAHGSISTSGDAGRAARPAAISLERAPRAVRQRPPRPAARTIGLAAPAGERRGRPQVTRQKPAVSPVASTGVPGGRQRRPSPPTRAGRRAPRTTSGAASTYHCGPRRPEATTAPGVVGAQVEVGRRPRCAGRSVGAWPEARAPSRVRADGRPLGATGG